MKIIELFAGAGGIAKGFTDAGNVIVWANDNNKDAVKTYIRNMKPTHPVICGDVWTALEGDLPDCDCVVGGSPCQSYSLANLNRTGNDDRSFLYRALILAAKKTNAKFVMMENVAGIESVGEGKVLPRILKDFEDGGYNIAYTIINAKHFETSQNRPRFIALAWRKDLKEIIIPLLDKCVKNKPHRNLSISNFCESTLTLRDAIGDLPEEPDDSIPNHTGSTCKVKINNHVGNRATDWNKIAPAVLGRGAGGGGPLIAPHPNGKRRMTCRECARIQTFPDDFIFEGANSSVYRQIGNAVPVKLAYHLGLWLKQIEDASATKRP